MSTPTFCARPWQPWSASSKRRRGPHPRRPGPPWLRSHGPRHHVAQRRRRRRQRQRRAACRGRAATPGTSWSGATPTLGATRLPWEASGRGADGGAGAVQPAEVRSPLRRCCGARPWLPTMAAPAVPCGAGKAQRPQTPRGGAKAPRRRSTGRGLGPEARGGLGRSGQRARLPHCNFRRAPQLETLERCIPLRTSPGLIGTHQ
mmetsp:Transcript_31605/g.97237  ORF Transcript_31605/g.97237 Transcript_31605/m.97237 type:complete len:203 (-) Transcript_31605:9-617(-)